jgi:hypothetical protein
MEFFHLPRRKILLSPFIIPTAEDFRSAWHPRGVFISIFGALLLIEPHNLSL